MHIKFLRQWNKFLGPRFQHFGPCAKAYSHQFTLRPGLAAPILGKCARTEMGKTSTVCLSGEDGRQRARGKEPHHHDPALPHLCWLGLEGGRECCCSLAAADKSFCPPKGLGFLKG